jgi:hypothetical protein
MPPCSGLPVDIQVGPNRLDKRCQSPTRADLYAISAFGLHTAGRSSSALTGPHSASEFVSAGDLPLRQRAIIWHSMVRHLSSPCSLQERRSAA